MSSVTTTTGQTVIAALNTVNVAANVITGLMSNAVMAYDMLYTYVSTDRTKQLASSKIAMSQFLIDLEEDPAIAIAEKRKRRTDRLKNDAELAALYSHSKNELKGVMEEIRESMNIPKTQHLQVIDQKSA